MPQSSHSSVIGWVEVGSRLGGPSRLDMVTVKPMTSPRREIPCTHIDLQAPQFLTLFLTVFITQNLLFKSLFYNDLDHSR